MTARIPQATRTLAVMQSSPCLTADSLAGRTRPLVIQHLGSSLNYSKPATNSSQAIGSENAHPGAAVWVPLVILFTLSVAAYLLFMAKAMGSWPFGH
jgi:hypothetical protein